MSRERTRLKPLPQPCSGLPRQSARLPSTHQGRLERARLPLPLRPFRHTGGVYPQRLPYRPDRLPRGLLDQVAIAPRRPSSPARARLHTNTRTTGHGAIDVFGRGPLSRASRPFRVTVLEGRQRVDSGPSGVCATFRADYAAPRRPEEGLRSRPWGAWRAIRRPAEGALDRGAGERSPPRGWRPCVALTFVAPRMAGARAPGGWRPAGVDRMKAAANPRGMQGYAAGR